MHIKEYTKKDFAWTKWGAADIKKETDRVIKEKKAVYAEIKKIPKEERTFENTIYALEVSDHDLMDVVGFIHIHAQANVEAKIRTEAHKAEMRIMQDMVDIEYDEKIYEAVKEYAAKKEKLTGTDKKLMEDTLVGYKRMGFALPVAKRKQLQKNVKRLSALSQRFEKNINDYQDHILVTKEELDGLPQNYIDGLTRDKKTAKYKVTLDYPDVGPFLAKATNEGKRKELADKNLKKGGKKNITILEEILQLRRENAKLLGYKTHADYTTELRTVKTAKRAISFVDRLMKKVQKGAKEELAELESLKQEMTGNKKARLQYYDVAFYSDQLQQKKYAVDSEKVREYFPAEQVKKGTLNIYSTLFGITFEKIDMPTWQKDIDVYRIKDKGKPVAYFALDLYPREGKYGHACVIDVVNGRAVSRNDKERVAPFGVMFTNFPKPRKNHPSLLSHGEVETFFHEFGHMMHHTLSETKYASQAGVNVAWDFVEAPSQMLEHWVWDKNMLNKLSSHYKTQKPIPEELFKKIYKTKFHLVRYGTLRQFMYAKFDLELHTKRITNVRKLYRTIMQEKTGLTYPKDSLFPAGFGHIAGGYDAGYYGYMWSKVFASDMFTRFARNGLLNKKVGGEYRKKILAKGSSEDEMKLVEDFLGRKPNEKAFLREIGIKK